MMQRNYFCVILHVKHKKYQFSLFLLDFLELKKIQDGNHV